MGRVLVDWWHLYFRWLGGNNSERFISFSQKCCWDAAIRKEEMKLQLCANEALRSNQKSKILRTVLALWRKHSLASKYPSSVFIGRKPLQSSDPMGPVEPNPLCDDVFILNHDILALQVESLQWWMSELCKRFKAKVNCYEVFERIWQTRNK